MVEEFDPVGAIAEILTAHGPLSEEDIVGHLREAGVADPEDLVDELLDEFSCPAAQLVDERWVWLPALLAGRVFTRRLSAVEATHDLLTVTPDLDPITALCDHDGYRVVDGSALQLVLGFDRAPLEQRGIPPEVIDPLGALLLAPGTLAALGAAEGDLVGVRLTEAGLAVEAVSGVAKSALGEVLTATVADGAPVYFDAAVWTACAADQRLFAEPLSPLSEIADDFGLARSDEWLAAGGFDFDRWRFQLGCAGLAARHDLESDDAFALYTLVQFYDHLALLLDVDDASGPLDRDAAEADLEQFTDLVGELGIVLADPDLAQVLLTETIGASRGGAAALAKFADMLERKVPRHARVGVRWLRAVALQRSGDIDTAERELLEAETLNPDWPWVLVDLARIASDRGDAEGGLALLHRAAVEPDHPLVELLQRHRPEPRRDIGRNELCWCGSGRKYKKCHLGHEQLPLSERVGWLYTKAMDHALLTGWRPLLAEAGYERGRYDDDDDFDPMFAALSDPLVLDAVLFEGGAFAEFLRLRGSLLPQDERALAEQWVLVERSVFEVQQVQPGRDVTVRDVRSGDNHQVVEPTASRVLRPGQLICARAVPVGEGMQFFGGIEPVELHERGELIELLDSEPDAVSLVAHLSRRFAPLTLANTEGRPLARRLPADDDDAVGADDPAMAAVLDDFIRDYETKWLDESIPALDGCTPRQAADDPTRRGDLVKLLDSFPAGAAASGGMDVDRLRDALGLR